MSGLKDRCLKVMAMLRLADMEELNIVMLPFTRTLNSIILKNI